MYTLTSYGWMPHTVTPVFPYMKGTFSWVQMRLPPPPTPVLLSVRALPGFPEQESEKAILIRRPLWPAGVSFVHL